MCGSPGMCGSQGMFWSQCTLQYPSEIKWWESGEPNLYITMIIAQSLDLNIIETIWKVYKCSIGRYILEIQSKKDSIHVVTEIWWHFHCVI